MENSERIARALESMFRCYDCREWLPASKAAYDIRRDSEDVEGVVCFDCLDDLKELAAQWPSREVA